MTAVDEQTPPFAIHLFGPFEVRLNGAPLPRLRTRKAQWLLALLALRAGSEVDRSWLAGTLWPDSSPSQGLALLRRELTDLRRALGPEASRLCAPTPHTLLLDLTGAEADIVTFDAAIAALDAPSLQRAAALYRGPLLQGCEEEWVFSERQVREQAFLQALEHLAAQATERGEAAAAERYLRQAVTIDPLRETAQRTLLQLLAAAGNYPAALQAYRELRLRLHEELNAEPDPETTSLFQQLRAESRRRAQAPSAFLATTLPHAPSDADPMAADEVVDDFPVLPPLAAFRHNLPLQLTSFLGRERELAAVKERLVSHRLVTLTGVGGCGKTRLALQVAADLIYSFRDGVWLVELAPLRDPALVPAAIAQALAVQENQGQPLTESLKQYLQERQLLLVLDNFEHLLEAATGVAELLARAPGLTVLATSRASLRLRGEQEFSVPPLALPDPQRLPPVEALSEYAAVALFIQRAGDVQPDFVLTAENAAAVAAICQRLDGLPLALELAAARVKLLSPKALQARLERRLPVLTGGARDLPARQQTLQNTIAWSFDLLDESEKTLFRQLSVFVGGCALQAVEAVCCEFGFALMDPGVGPDPSSIRNPQSKIQNEEVLDGLASLVDKSLLRQSDVDGEPRFWMLETIREYAGECLIASGEAEQLRQKQAAFFLRWAEEAQPGLRSAELGVWLARFEREHDNLRAALEWYTADKEQPEAGLRLASALGRFWAMRGYLSEGRERLSAVLAREPASGASSVRAKALSAAGSLAHFQGDFAAARSLQEESLAIFRQLEDHNGAADVLHAIGFLARSEGDYGAARQHLENSLAVFRQLGDRWSIASSLNLLGVLTSDQGDYASAHRFYHEALAIWRELGYQSGVAGVLGNLGYVAYQQGDDASARSSYEESLATRRELGDRQGTAHVLNFLGMVVHRQGDRELSRIIQEESLAIRSKAGDRRGIAECLEALAELVGAEGQPEWAASLWGSAEALREALGAPLGPMAFAHQGRCVAAAREILGGEAFAAAWTAGRAMPLEQVIESAARYYQKVWMT